MNTMKRIATLNLTLTLLSLSIVLNNYLPNQPHGVQVLFEEKNVRIRTSHCWYLLYLCCCHVSQVKFYY